MRSLIRFSWLLLLWLAVLAKAQSPSPTSELLLRELRYDGKLSDHEARFSVALDIESAAKGETSMGLFEGDVALSPPKLPKGLRIVREANQYRLLVTRAGRYQVKLELVAKIKRVEPWNEVAFLGPAASIAALTAEATGAGMEVQLLAGTPDIESAPAGQATGPSGRVRAMLGPERKVALRWQSKAAEAARKSLVTAETTATVQVTPTVIRYQTRFEFEVVQGSLAQLNVLLPATQALTRVEGPQIRDWQVKPAGERQLLTVELIKPAEKTYQLGLFSEQTIEADPFSGSLSLPEPQAVERETGTLTVWAADTVIETESTTGLRQVNAADGAAAAYRFYARPFALGMKLRRIEPVVSAAARVTARLEESRLLVSHSLTVNVEKAGIYSMELSPLGSFVVTEVRGEGIEDWKAREGRLAISFSSRVLGARTLEIQLEQAQKAFPEQITVVPLRVTNAARQTAKIGAASAAGIHLKTAELIGLREMPIASLEPRTDELLAFVADQPDWTLKLATEKLTPRVVADIFNLVTIGDGLVGGSATFRYAIVNQGVQEFKVKLPAHWKNIEFTGPNIRGKDQQGDIWTISLQDKAWGAYTLLVTYDQQFDPRKATLAVGGAHALGVERETGLVAITSAASLQLREAKAAEPLRRVDESELSAADRALISRSVLLAYRYTGDTYELAVEVNRFEELPVLQAVADRTQLTTVLTEAGQMLTQASFMVKNNEKQFQRFLLPKGAEFWSSYVNGQAVKPEKQDDALLVPLPRGANRDQAFAVEIVYAQKTDPLKSLGARSLALTAPQTDIQTTFAEWELFVPARQSLHQFGGNMTVARGTTYTLRDAWEEFARFYFEVFRSTENLLWLLAGLVMVVAFVLAALRRGWHGAFTVLAVLFVMALLCSMLLPGLSKAKAKAKAFPAETTTQAPAILQPTAAPTPSGTARGLYAGGGGAGIGGGAGPALGDQPQAGRAFTPVVAGIRPIRIEIPRAGNKIVFTKVLNVQDEPLTVQARTMPTKTRNLVRGGTQLALFLVGLVIFWWQVRRPVPASLRLTLGLALMLASVAGYLVATRLFGSALIIAVPVLILALSALLIRRVWKRRGGTAAVEAASGTPAAAPTVVTVLALLCSVAAAKAQPEAKTEPPAQRASGCVVQPVSILTANYSGTVRERVAEVDALIRLTADSANQGVALFGDDVAIKEFSATPSEVKLVRDGNGVKARLAKRGEATLRVKLLVKLGGDVTRRQLAFGIPAALSSTLSLTVDEPEAAVDFPTAISHHSVTDKQQTRVEAVLGAGERVDLQWTPRVKRAAEIAATVFCQSASLANFSSGVMNLRTWFEYQVTQGELREVRVRLPAGQRLLRVQGELIRTWQVKEGNGTLTLTVELLKGVSPAYRLLVETEQTVEQLPRTASVEAPLALEVKRQTGWVALSDGEELGLTVEKAQGLQKVDTAEFIKALGPAASLVRPEAVASAYQFLKPDFGLNVRVEVLRPQIEAVVHNRTRIGAEQVHLFAQVDYIIKRAGVFMLRLVLPADFRVETVSGNEMAQWVEKSDQDLRVLEVALKQRTLGRYSLKLQLVKSVTTMSKTLEVLGIHPLGTEKLAGFVAVGTEVGLQAKAGSFDGLTEVPVATVPEAGAGLAYKFISPEPVPAQSPWKLSVALETIEPWVRAEVVNWVTLSDTLVNGRALVRYDIANAPVKEFRVRVPKTFRNVEVTGHNIRRRDQDGEVRRVELQNKVIGPYTLIVTWEMPWSVNAKESTLELPGIEALGVERDTGAVAVNARPPLRVEAKLASSELIKIDTRELPEWAGRADGSTVLAYRYLRPGYRLSVAAQRFDQAEVLQALADDARLTTVVADDGQMMTQLTLSIRNNGRQFLEVALPRGAQVWSAFVAGRAVRPSLREGRLLLPLEQTADDASVAVELTYVSAEQFPRTRGEVGLASPALDVPVKAARWELYLPPDYRYSKFEGTMTRTTTTAPVVTSFSLVDYSQVEHKQTEERRRDVQVSLGKAKSELARGNVKNAQMAFSQLRERYGAVADGDARGVKELEAELNRAQSSNLILGQQEVLRNNADFLGRFAGQQAELQQQVLNYQNAAAEQQFTKLQQAQEVRAATVRPLRVNLPTHGLRHAFEQVLQTEVGKPMVIRFAAASMQATNWAMRIVWAGAAFLGLWAITAFALPARKT